MTPHDLMKTARAQTERPTQAGLRRAVSTAYYAMFHILFMCSTGACCFGSDRGRSVHRHGARPGLAPRLSRLGSTPPCCT